MARKIYYKVLSRHALTSCTTHLKYTVKQWTEPTILGSKLAVFASLNAAKQYVCPSSEDVYECHVKAPIKSYQYRAALYSSYSNDIEKYWQIVANAQKAKKNISKALKQAGFFREWPPYTILCNSVMLLKLV